MMLEHNSLHILPAHVFAVDGHYFLVDIVHNNSHFLPEGFGGRMIDHPMLAIGMPISEFPDSWHSWFAERDLLVGDGHEPELPFGDEPRVEDNPDLFALFINVTEKCNLRCRYCIIEDTYLKKVVDVGEEVIRKAIEEFFEQSGLEEVEIHFFGGEPLLNPDAIISAVEIAESLAITIGKKVTFVISTNGVLLGREWLNYFEKHRFTVLLSLDGPREVQNHSRRFGDGHGSFDSIIGNARELVRRFRKANLEFAVRGIVTGDTPDFTPSLDFFEELGFPAVCISPVFTDSETDYFLDEAALETFFDANKRFVDRHIKAVVTGRGLKSMNTMLFMQKVSAGIPLRHFCWAGLQSITVSPSGAYYPCFNWAGLSDDKYRMGDVYRKLNQAERTAFIREVAVDSLPQCRECWARYICSGGCSACSAKLCQCVNGIEDEALRCRYFRHQIEMAIYAKHRIDALGKGLSIDGILVACTMR